MMWLKIVRGSVSQITWDYKRGMLGVIKPKKGGCLLWHLKIWSRLAIPHPSCSVLIPTSLWVKSCDTTIIYVHDACSYRIVGALRLLALVFSWPSRYSITIVSNALTPPVSGAVSWNGPLRSSECMRESSQTMVYLPASSSSIYMHLQGFPIWERWQWPYMCAHRCARTHCLFRRVWECRVTLSRWIDKSPSNLQ